VRDIPENWSRAGNTLIYMTLGAERTLRAFCDQARENVGRSSRCERHD
jgi:hypothetical protein